jgi:peptide/nickel transport system substrate-binding protein
MGVRIQGVAGLPLAALATIALAACGGHSRSGSARADASRAGVTPTVTMVQSTFPQSLDPARDYSTQGSQVNWLVYTGLVTYAHHSGAAGGRLIPGLATTLPKISDGGKAYSVTLRRGLRFSNGTPVKASDFITAVERAIKVPWGGSGAFITPIIAGGSAFSAGRAKRISGITADDRTGRITIHLTHPYGPFENVLAFPALGLVPGNTPMTVQANDPPPGVGPYKVTHIDPQHSYDVVKNSDWTPIPGIPSGHVNVDVTVDLDLDANVLAVLNNTTDVYDWSDTVPGAVVSRIRREAADRFKNVNLGTSTYYIFLDVRRAPFNNPLVRRAVVTGLNRRVMAKLAGGSLVPACFFLPPAIPGHPTGPCPYGDPVSGGDIAKAKQLIRQSGDAGAKVTVFSEIRPPAQQWMTYYTSYLDQIGLKASLKVVANATYFSTVGTAKLQPQTGLGEWSEDFPNPVDFYLLLNGQAIEPTDNPNLSQVDDPRINAAIARLGPVPTAKLAGGPVKQWQAIDEYTARKAYIAVLGYPKFPFFMSQRMDFRAAIEQPLYGWDFTSFQLK